MTRRHVDSYNGINAIPIGADAVSVSKVTDADLTSFKLTAPHDFIRLQVAGIEGEYLMMDQLQRTNFFNRQNLPHEMLYILTTLNTTGYVDFSADPETVDVETDKMNAKEPDIPSRDFTGFNFTGWVYDLFRPEESYSERGVHPLGNGIDRYRKISHLTEDELRYLKKQGNSQYLNFLSPMMIGFRSITIDKDRDIRGNFAVRNLLTSFGNDVSLNLFAQHGKYKGVAIIHRYRNYSNNFHALELQLLDYPLNTSNISISPRFILGTQPKGQQFKTGSASFFGYAGARANFLQGSKFSPYIEAELKTNGWLAGNEFLNGQWGIKAGMSFRFY